MLWLYAFMFVLGANVGFLAAILLAVARQPEYPPLGHICANCGDGFLDGESYNTIAKGPYAALYAHSACQYRIGQEVAR